VCCYSGRTQEDVDPLVLRPSIDERPIPGGELIGEALHIISYKETSEDDPPDGMVRRQSYRSLQQPDVSTLDWVAQSDGKEQVRRAQLKQKSRVVARKPRDAACFCLQRMAR